MKRNLIPMLQQWKEKETRKPVYLTGIKGVGKTYLACEFFQAFFDSYLYINFEQNQELTMRWNRLSTEEIFPALAGYFELPEELLFSIPFIFDEVHFCKDFIQKLLHLTKEKKNLYWMFLSSYDILTEEEQHQIEHHILFPMQFDEFLTALGKDWYVEIIMAHSQNHKKLPDIVHNEMLATFDEYMLIGGMPDVINEYLNMESAVNVAQRQQIQQQILLFEMKTIAGEKTGHKCQQLYNSIAEQLDKPNQKFQFNLIRRGVTYQMYKEALDFLTGQHLVYKLEQLDKEQQFKLFFPDFSLNPSSRNGELTKKEYDIRLENYLCQTLLQKKKFCYFWEAKSKAVVDFILKEENYYLPLELKKEGKSKTKSIQSFVKQFPVNKTIRISSSNFLELEEMINLPVYALFCF